MKSLTEIQNYLNKITSDTTRSVLDKGPLFRIFVIINDRLETVDFPNLFSHTWALHLAGEIKDEYRKEGNYININIEQVS